MDRRHLAFCAAICLEAAVCFAVPAFLVFYGILLLPFSALGMARDASRYGPLVVLTLFGAAGIAGVVRVLVLLCRRRQHDPQRPMTLSALVCSAAAVLFYASSIGTRTSPTPPLLVVTIVLPVACTLHLVYLARRVLFA